MYLIFVHVITEHLSLFLEQPIIPVVLMFGLQVV